MRLLEREVGAGSGTADLMWKNATICVRLVRFSISR
jgi:hypothetical protein